MRPWGSSWRRQLLPRTNASLRSLTRTAPPINFVDAELSCQARNEGSACGLLPGETTGSAKLSDELSLSKRRDLSSPPKSIKHSR